MMIDEPKTPEFINRLSPTDKQELFTFLDNYFESYIYTDARLMKVASEASLSEAISLTLDSLVAKTGRSREDVLNLALTFYEVAIDGIEKGQRVVLLDKDYRFVKEIVGLVAKPSESANQKSAAG